MADVEDKGPIDADKLTGPLAFVTISGCDSGWYHVYVKTSAPTAAAAMAHAALFLECLFPGKHKLVRKKPWGEEARDSEHSRRVVTGGCRFAFELVDGLVDYSDESAVRFVGFGLPEAGRNAG